MRKVFHSLRFLLLLAFVVGMSQCQLLGFLNFSNFTLGNNFIAQATADSISETESDLLAEGPIDLPVTIAKLESPDADLLTITEINGGSSFLVRERPLYQGLARILRIKGLPNAIRDVEEAPLVVGFPYDQVGDIVGSEVAVNVLDDGSFSIDVATDEDALIAAGDNNNFISPFLHITEDPDTGYFSIITTNASANLIDSNTQMAVDSDGYYYLNINNDDGTKSLIRRNVDGSLVQEIVSDSADDLDAMVVRSSFKTAFTFSSGTSTGSLTLQLTSIVSDSASESKISSLVPGANPLNASEIVSFNYELAEIENYDFTENKIKIEITDDEEGVILIDRNNVEIQYVNTTSTTAINIVRSGVYEDLWAALDAENNILYVWVLKEGFYSLYKADLANDPAFAWGNREAIIEFVTFDDVRSIAAEKGTLAYVLEDGDDVQAYVYTGTNAPSTINDLNSDSNTYSNLKVSIDGSIVFACNLSGAKGQLAYHNISGSGFSDITTDSTFTVCDETVGSYYVSPTFLHLYRTDNATQHTMIGIDQLD